MKKNRNKVSPPDFARTNYYIDKPFQNQFLISFSTVVLLSTILFFAIMAVLHYQAFDLLPDKAAVLVQQESTDKAVFIHIDEKGTAQVDEQKGIPYLPASKKVYSAFDLYFLPVLFVTAMNILLILLFSLFFSHRLAGPMLRIKFTLKNYLEGNGFERIHLRQGDFMQDVGELINEALEEKTLKIKNPNRKK